MTTLAEWKSVAGAASIDPILGVYSINGNDPDAIEQLFVNLMRDGVTVENALNATRANNTNYWSSSIDEGSNFRGAIKIPVNISSLEVNI